MTVRSTFRAGEPCWADCLVTDVEGARGFYGGVFGWTFGAADPDAPYLYALLDGRRVAGLNPITPASPMRPAWNVYLATGDADKTAARVADLGGTVLLGPAPAGRHGRFLIARDPAGAQVAFRQTCADRPGLELADVPGSATWYELWVRDAAAADGFYAGLFDYALSRVGDARYVDYLSYDLEDVPRAGRFRLSGADIPEEVSARWVLYLAVADCDATFATAVAAGARAVRAPGDSPRGRWAILRDPWGALFALLTR